MKQANIIRVRDVMKSNFDIVDRTATVEEVLSKMEHLDTKCIVVNKRDEEDEYGILLISDIARKVLALDHAPERVNVYEVMTKPVITVRPDMNIKYCARLFDRFNLSRAPVVEEGQIVGIVSLTDLILRGIRKQQRLGGEAPILKKVG
jgi:CBS domain-containing protein